MLAEPLALHRMIQQASNSYTSECTDAPITYTSPFLWQSSFAALSVAANISMATFSAPQLAIYHINTRQSCNVGYHSIYLKLNWWYSKE